MKKFLLAGAALLLSLVIVSCDLIPGDTDNGTEPQYTENGTRLVSISLNAGGRGDRALNDTMAKAGVDYYEAVFKNGANYYRTAWHKGEEGRILLPIGTYGTAGEAMLFAGKASDKTLLATGTLDTNKNVTPTTTSLTFVVSALTAGVDADGANSGFKITGPVGPPTYVTPAAALPKTYIKNESRAVPVFLVPADTAGITATYTVGGLANTGAAIFIDASLSSLESVGVTPENNPGDKVDSIPVKADIVPPGAGFVGAAGILNITIDQITIPPATPAKAGAISRIEIKLPVTAIAAASATSGIIWYIRGGLTNYEMDFGGLANSQGGSILLGIGSVNTIGLDPAYP